jgi:hypothetical protein
MKKFIKAIILAAALAAPALFASNAFAIPSCGTNCTSATKNPHGYTAATPTNCYSCHTPSTTTGGGTSGGTTGGTLTVKQTTKSCGACAVGTAPMGVGAHKNVTATTLCSVCHTGTGSTGGTGGSTGGTMVVRLTKDSCGACAVGTAPMSVSAHKNVTATTVCSVCHTSTTTGGSTGGTVGIYPTKHSCGACVVGTAPGSVSAHKNVNTNNTVCSACHMPSSTGGTGGSTGGHHDNDHGTTGGSTGGHHDDDHQQTSPGNSDFGHSHKQNQGQHRGHDD